MQPFLLASSPRLNARGVRRPKVLMLALCVLSLGQHALAEGARDLSNEAIADLYDQGTQAVDAGDPRRARQIFLKIWPHRQTYDVAMNLGYLELKLGNFPGAAHYLRHALDHFPPTERLDVRRELETDLAQVTERVATVHLSVSTPGATIQVDEVPSGQAPLDAPLFLAPGSHTLSAAFDQDRAERALDVAAGREYQVVLELSEPAPIAPSSGAAASPGSGPEAAHATEGVPDWVPAAATGAIAVVGVGLGIGFTIDALKNKDQAEDLAEDLEPSACFGGGTGSTRASCAELSDANRAVDRDTTIAALGFCGALVAGVATYLLWPAPPSRDPSAIVAPERTWQVSPRVDTHSAELSLSKSF